MSLARSDAYRLARAQGHRLRTIRATRQGPGLYVKGCRSAGCDLMIVVEYGNEAGMYGADQPCPWVNEALRALERGNDGDLGGH